MQVLPSGQAYCDTAYTRPMLFHVNPSHYAGSLLLCNFGELVFSIKREPVLTAWHYSTSVIVMARVGTLRHLIRFAVWPAQPSLF